MTASDDLAVEQLQQAIDRLPLELREPLTLVRVEGLSNTQAAEQMDMSPCEVERRIARALVRLDRDLERMKWHEWRNW